MAKQLHFNKDGSALKKMQAGVDKLASVVGITLGPKVCCLLILQHSIGLAAAHPGQASACVYWRPMVLHQVYMAAAAGNVIHLVV